MCRNYNASWPEPFHNNNDKKNKTYYKHNQYFPNSVGKHEQYILPEICLLSRNEQLKSELKTHMRRYKAVRRTTLKY